ncbi:MAG TPA: hypothetical protein VFX28_10165, partial [Methylomirabilota bacterium]|nr:hypothetical protein [Methylomirabilota bacterium]
MRTIVTGMVGLLAAAGIGLAAAAVHAQQAPAAPAAAEEKGPNTGRISLTAGVDYATDYYFRGIVQETEDAIVQPYGSVTFRLYEGETGLTGLNFTLGTWNSLHWGPTGDGGLNADPQLWYESDFYATLAATLFKDLTAGVTYTAYMSPNDFFQTVQEVAFSLGYNDSALLGPFALNPSVLLAFETS